MVEIEDAANGEARPPILDLFFGRDDVVFGGELVLGGVAEERGEVNAAVGLGRGGETEIVARPDADIAHQRCGKTEPGGGGELGGFCLASVQPKHGQGVLSKPSARADDDRRDRTEEQAGEFHGDGGSAEEADGGGVAEGHLPAGAPDRPGEAERDKRQADVVLHQRGVCEDVGVEAVEHRRDDRGEWAGELPGPAGNHHAESEADDQHHHAAAHDEGVAVVAFGAEEGVDDIEPLRWGVLATVANKSLEWVSDLIA